MAVVATEAAVKAFDENNSSGTSAAGPSLLSATMNDAMQTMPTAPAISADQTLV
jgi:hypothetical protein